jgi:ribose transport system substrate-binding protein
MPDTVKIGVVLQGSLHQYWKFVQAGAKKAVADLAASDTQINLICKAPLREDDRSEQKEIVERFVREVDGIVLAPFDSEFLVETVDSAASRGIAFVVIDSLLKSSSIVSFIATDNKSGGALAADRMGQRLEGGGKVLLMRYQKGVASTEARETGFAERIRAYPEIELLRSEEYAGVTRDAAKVAGEALLRKHGDELRGVFTPNESSTAGMLMALQSVQRAGEIRFVGFDASELYLDTMRYGKIDGLVVQNPFLMGELGVRTVVDHLQSKVVQKRIDLRPVMVTPDNIDAPEIAKLLHLSRG